MSTREVWGGRVHCWIGKLSSGVHILDSFHLFTFIACLYDELCILMLPFLCAGRRRKFAVDMVRWPWGTLLGPFSIGMVPLALMGFLTPGGPVLCMGLMAMGRLKAGSVSRSWPFFLLRRHVPFLSDPPHLGVIFICSES
jgi:hypothetical protein